MASYNLGSDIGGTFTDFVLLNNDTGEIRIEKCLTTPHDPAQGVMEGVNSFERAVPGCLRDTESLFHATTLVINAIIERKGARTGLITTEGFRDVVEIAREERYDPYDILAEYIRPLVPRHLRFEVVERIHASGAVLQPLDLESVRRAISQLRDAGIESVAVVLLHSYINPEHEQIVARELATATPGTFVSISSEVLPEIKEYERTSTTVVNAYAKPLVHRYLEHLEEALAELGYRRRLLLMLSSGGITSSETGRRFPVRIVESGPAAGVIASEYFGKMAGVRDLISLDMGGTTAKACMIRDGRASRAFEFEVARLQRFKRGSGMPLKLPVVDLIEIGAGGGSIAKVSSMGTLQVGPESAGASPGPACYALGGTQPTVSDSDLLLGYLNPDYFLGGEMRLDGGAASAAMEKRIARPLGVTLTDAAWGIHNIVNENMAMAAKIHMLERGEDPARFSLVAFGGAGPVHAYGLARKLKVRRILVPPAAGVMSAVGLLVAPGSFDFVRTHKVRLRLADFKQIEGIYEGMRTEALRMLREVREVAEVSCEMSADMRYVGQGYEVNVPLPGNRFDLLSVEQVTEAFERVYRQLYHRVYSDVELELMNLRLVATLPTSEFRLKLDASARQAAPGQERGHLARAGETPALPAVIRPNGGGAGEAGARKGTRRAFFPDTAYLDCPVYDRYRLPSGARLQGPALIEERECTIVVGPDAEASVDAHGIVTLTIGEG